MYTPLEVKASLAAPGGLALAHLVVNKKPLIQYVIASF